MKTIISALVVSVSLLSSGVASARSMRPMNVSADLLRWNVDKDLSGAQNLTGGSIQIDRLVGRLAGQVTLRLDPAWSCPPNALCAMMMPPPIFLTMPIVNTIEDRCGSVITTARVDERPVDGNLAELTIVDHSNSICNFAIAATEIEYRTSFYDRRAGHEVRTLSTFEASRLTVKN